MKKNKVIVSCANWDGALKDKGSSLADQSPANQIVSVEVCNLLETASIIWCSLMTHKMMNSLQNFGWAQFVCYFKTTNPEILNDLTN